MKKIMFNDRYGLTQAVLEGRKSQTRRKITHPDRFKGKDVCGFYVYRRATDGVVTEVCMYDEDEISIDEGQIFPKYKIGELVAVAQSYKDAVVDFIECDVRNGHNHLLGNTKGMKGWNNKMFVLPEAMPHQIRITNVRVERLQDISDEDCLREGVRKVLNENGIDVQYYVGHNACFETPREAFANLIDKVSGKGTWDSNPYVWVYDFELIK